MANYKPKLSIEYLKVTDLNLYENNSRTHDTEQVMQIVNSIKEFGFTNPILVDENNGVIAGHGRLMACNKANITDVPCVRLTGLTEAQRKAYVIADNSLALNASWDVEKLQLEVECLKDLDFDIDLLALGLEEVELSEQESPIDDDDDDDIPDVEQKIITKTGDIWLLGEHRVMCGDSAKADDVGRLMAGKKASLLHTDPPYGIKAGRGKLGGIKNDTMAGLDSLLDSAFNNAKNSLHEGTNIYVWVGFRAFSLVETLFNRYWDVNNCIIWKKPSIGLGGNGYRYQHELCIFSGNIRDKSKSDVWEFNRCTSGLHPTLKPVDLVVKAIEDSNLITDEIVLDLFGGSGSTLIACEKTEQKCYTMELDAKYCDVIIRRWQKYTEKKATNHKTGVVFDV